MIRKRFSVLLVVSLIAFAKLSAAEESESSETASDSLQAPSKSSLDPLEPSAQSADPSVESVEPTEESFEPASEIQTNHEGLQNTLEILSGNSLAIDNLNLNTITDKQSTSEDDLKTDKISESEPTTKGPSTKKPRTKRPTTIRPTTIRPTRKEPNVNQNKDESPTSKLRKCVDGQNKRINCQSKPKFDYQSALEKIKSNIRDDTNNGINGRMDNQRSRPGRRH